MARSQNYVRVNHKGKRRVNLQKKSRLRPTNTPEQGDDPVNSEEQQRNSREREKQRGQYLDGLQASIKTASQDLMRYAYREIYHLPLVKQRTRVQIVECILRHPIKRGIPGVTDSGEPKYLLEAYTEQAMGKKG